MPRLALMEGNGEVIAIPGGPVGMRDSYRFGLDLPDRLAWSDDDIVAYVEDDYLLVEDAFEEFEELGFFGVDGVGDLGLGEGVDVFFFGGFHVGGF